MTKEDDAILSWLNNCPSPVIARVIKEPEDIVSLSITASLYDCETLVVIDINTLREFYSSLRSKIKSLRKGED